MSEQMEISVIPAQKQDNGPLIKLVQLPIIEERLKTLKPFVEEKVTAAMAMPCTEDTLTEIKHTRAELNALFEEAEAHRKGVKTAVMKPYDDFEKVYKECITDPFKRADADLKGKVASVENGMKEACENGIRKLFDELTTAHHLAWLKYERVGIRISLTDAKAKTQPPKKLAAQVTDFVERVAQDVEMICGLDNSAEIMTEYRQTLNAPVAIQTVNLRHQRIAEAEAEAARRAEIRRQEEEAAQKVEAIAQQMEEPVKQVMAFAPAAPVVEPVVEAAPPAPETYTVKFAVSGTLEQLRSLKRFLESGGYEYTDIK